MTMPNLPNVQYGNTASDLGQGINSFVQGMVGQRMREQQLAMQKAMTQANVGRLGAETGLEQAQTGDIQQQEIQRQHANEPAGPAEFSLLQSAYPHVSMQQWQSSGITRGDAHDLAKSGMMMQRLGFTQSRFDEGSMLSELNRFKSDPEVKNALGVAAVYRNSKTLMATGAPVTEPSLLLDLGQSLGMPGQPNARAVGTELANLLRGEGLSWTQRAQRFVNKLVTEGDQFTLDPETQQAIPEIIKSIATARMHRYDQMRNDLKARSQTILGVPLPDQAIGADPYADIRQELSGGASPAPQPGGRTNSGVRLPGVDQP